MLFISVLEYYSKKVDKFYLQDESIHLLDYMLIYLARKAGTQIDLLHTAKQY